MFIIIDMNIKGNKYENKYYIFSAIMHLLPLFLLCLNGELKTKYAFETMVIFFIIYLLYLNNINTDIISVYIDDRKRIYTIKEVKDYLGIN